MNQITIIGNIGKELTEKDTENGNKFSYFSMACRSKDKDKPIWYKVIYWNGKFDKLKSYLTKGTLLSVCGDLQIPSIYKDKEGNSSVCLEIYVNSISLLNVKRSNAEVDGNIKNQNDEVIGFSKEELELF